MSDWFAIVNPAAGHGVCGRMVMRVLDTIRSGGVSVEAVSTEKPGDGIRLAREALGRGQTRLLAVGGEGTVNEVLNGIARAGALAEATLGTIPLGTGNSFLADFGLQSIEAMIERIASGADGSPTDLMRCRFARGNDVEGWLVDERLALNNLIVGFGADVGSLMNRRLKFLGKFGYTAGVMIELARLNPPSMTVEVDGSAADGTMTMVNVGNSQYTGGNMQIAPDAIVDDGLLDVIAIGPLSRLKLVAAFRLIFTGAHVDHPAVNVTKGRSVRIAAERPLPLLMDGDCIGATPVEIEVAPCALKVLR